uniref:Uncharacterized protein n=1 Tax=Manihot esculenta TaxID=3983 RepID=A0A2C9UA84_MANES
MKKNSASGFSLSLGLSLFKQGTIFNSGFHPSPPSAKNVVAAAAAVGGFSTSTVSSYNSASKVYGSPKTKDYNKIKRFCLDENFRIVIV